MIEVDLPNFTNQIISVEKFKATISKC